MKKLILFALMLIVVVFGSNFTRIERSPIVVIDAGHGGKDAGMKTKEGVTEKELTLSIAKKIEKLGTEKGVQIILTRSSDEFIALQDRTNNSNADIFISLHINANPQNKSKSGIECFISNENAALEKSKAFSTLLLKELKSLTGMKVNGVKTGGFHVLKNNPAPSVLLELGYLSNTSDLTFLKEEINQEIIATKIISSILKLEQ